MLEIRFTDKMTRDDYKKFEPVVKTMLDEHGKVRLLFDMLNCRGWKPGALWEDVKFDVKHFNDVERMTVIGRGDVRETASRFFGALTGAGVRYFDSAESPIARKWLYE